MKTLTEEQVFELLAKHNGDADFVALAESHETLRNELAHERRFLAKLNEVQGLLDPIDKLKGPVQ